MRPKVLIFSLAYHPHVGGAEIALKEITDRVSNIEFHLITARFSPADLPEEKLGNVRVYRIGRGGRSYVAKILFIPHAAIYALSLHRKVHFDALWAMMSYMLFPVIIMRFLGVSLPYALTLQEGDPFRHMFGRLHILPFRPLLTLGFRNASAIQTISTYLAGWAKRMGYQGPVEVIPNGVDLEHFSGPRIEHVGTVLVTTSRLVHKNGVDTIIRALPLLPNVRLSVLGVGPEEGKLRALAKEIGVSDRIEWVGYVGHESLPGYLRRADVFVRPSRSEGMGNSFIEAMAAGLPVIATQEGGIADFLFDARRNPDKPTTGWAVDKDAPEQIAEAVRDIIEQPVRTAEVVERAYTLVHERYGWDRLARAMYSHVFLSVLGGVTLKS